MIEATIFPSKQILDGYHQTRVMKKNDDEISGIVRPEDIGRNNKVYSRRMANALISYTGSGEVSNAGKVGWGTNLLMKLWPF